MLLLGATLMPAPARAASVDLGIGVGAYGGVSFGSGLPTRLSFGAQLRATTRVGERDSCSNKGFTVGGVTRLDFPTWNEPRLILGAIGTGVSDLKHGTLEAGLGLRLRHLGIDGLAGLQLGWGPFAARVDHTFNRSLWQATGGVALAPEWLELVTCVPGRPLRDEEGRVQRAQVNSCGELDGLHSLHVAADIWRDRAGAEWNSISAFLDLAAQLQSVGAPQHLILRAEQAAHDELHHTQLAAAMAQELGHGELTFAPLKQARPLTQGTRLAVQRLAVESWLDGCINEGIAAHIARKEAALSTNPIVKQTLTTIAADEQAHAQLAWDVLHFCVAQGGDEVAHLLWQTERRSGSSTANEVPKGLAEFGCGDESLQNAAISEVRHLCARRLSNVLAGQPV